MPKPEKEFVLHCKETNFTARYFRPHDGSLVATVILDMSDELFHVRCDGYNLGQYLDKKEGMKAVFNYLQVRRIDKMPVVIKAI